MQGQYNVDNQAFCLKIFLTKGGPLQRSAASELAYAYGYVLPSENQPLPYTCTLMKTIQHTLLSFVSKILLIVF